MPNHQIFSVRNIIAALFLIGSIVFYVLGVTHPLMSTKYQVIGIRLKSQEVTLFDSIRMFWESKDYFVALIILVFTFILPISKYFELSLRIVTGKKYPVLQGVDKWNMIDVFLVAMLLLNFKMNSNFIVMRLEDGTNFIAIAVITRLVTIALIDGLSLKKN